MIPQIEDSNNSIALLNQFPITENGLAEFTIRILEALNSGEVNPLDLKLQFKAIDMVSEVVKNRMNELALNEASKHGKKFEYRGFEIREQELGTKFIFDGCGDARWTVLEAERVRLVESLKERETFLKSLVTTCTIVDEDTGDVSTIYPPVKKSTTGLVLSLKKDKP